jgi:hypothetical protein
MKEIKQFINDLEKEKCTNTSVLDYIQLNALIISELRRVLNNFNEYLPIRYKGECQNRIQQLKSTQEILSKKIFEGNIDFISIDTLKNVYLLNNQFINVLINFPIL